MSSNRLRLGLGLSLAVSIMLAANVLADVQFDPSGLRQLRLTDSGDIVAAGHCYGGVIPPVPPGGTVSFFPLSAPPGMGIAKNGNLYFLGEIFQNSTTFPGPVVMRNGSTITASVTNQGQLYLRGKCRNSTGCSNTAWEPSVWDTDPYIREHNNCYNYANDTRTDTYAQPGTASGQGIQQMTVDEVRSAALRDGLTWVSWDFPGNNYDCGTGHLVYMAVWPNTDYHWYRLDQARGRWSHKLGGGTPRDFDNSLVQIIEPTSANRGNYVLNGGYYCTCGEHASIY